MGVGFDWKGIFRSRGNVLRFECGGVVVYLLLRFIKLCILRRVKVIFRKVME